MLAPLGGITWTMLSPRASRMLTVSLASACALSATAAGEVAGQSLPQLPSVPPVQLPSLPKVPPLQPPPKLELPSVSKAPTVPLPRPAVPTPSAPGAPTAPSKRSTAAPSNAAPTTSPGTSAAAPNSSARPRVAPTPRERRFRRSVKGLWACSYALGSFERKVLVRRAGLEGFNAASLGSVANQLRASLRRVRSAQSRGVRLLRGADRADGCAAMTAPAAGLGGSAKALLAVATAFALATDAGEAVASALKPSQSNDRAEVLGAQRTSTGVKVATAPRATVSLAAAGDDGPALWLLILLALLALATPLLLRRRREVTPAAPAPVHALPPPEPTPAPEPAPAPPPVAAIPAEDASPPSPTPRNGLGRAAGLAVTGLASLAVTLLMRARRKR